MKKFKNIFKTKVTLISGVMAGLIVGGAATAAVMAAIPDNNGVIHSCYKNSNGSLKVIDNASDSCGSGETALNWNQTGPQGPPGSSGNGGVVLHDANGQVLGNLIDFSAINSDQTGHNTTGVYNATLNRMIPIAWDNETSQYLFGEFMPAFFQSSDCTGQPYTANNADISTKTTLFRWSNGTTQTYGIVSDDASSVTVTDGSVLAFDGSQNAYICRVDSNDPTKAFPLTVVSLPFNTPVATPFKF